MIDTGGVAVSREGPSVDRGAHEGPRRLNVDATDLRGAGVEWRVGGKDGDGGVLHDYRRVFITGP